MRTVAVVVVRTRMVSVAAGQVAMATTEVETGLTQMPKAALQPAPQCSSVLPHQPCGEQHCPNGEPMQVNSPPHCPSGLVFDAVAVGAGCGAASAPVANQASRGMVLKRCKESILLINQGEKSI